MGDGIEAQATGQTKYQGCQGQTHDVVDKERREDAGKRDRQGKQAQRVADSIQNDVRDSIEQP